GTGHTHQGDGLASAAPQRRSRRQLAFDVAFDGGQLFWARGIAAHVALEQTHAADVETDLTRWRGATAGVSEHQLGAATAWVEDQQLAGKIETGQRTAKRQSRFFIASDDSRPDAEDLLGGVEEALGAIGVAQRAGAD